MTMAQVRSKTERIREFSALPFLLVAGRWRRRRVVPRGAAGGDR